MERETSPARDPSPTAGSKRGESIVGVQDMNIVSIEVEVKVEPSPPKVHGPHLDTQKLIFNRPSARIEKMKTNLLSQGGRGSRG